MGTSRESRDTFALCANKLSIGNCDLSRADNVFGEVRRIGALSFHVAVQGRPKPSVDT